MFPTEQKVTCPYNKSHTFAKEKFQFHVDRCKDGLKFKHLYDKCQFNPFHILLKVDLKTHEEYCPDREQTLRRMEIMNVTLRRSLTQPRERSRDRVQMREQMKEQKKEQVKVEQQEDTLSECEQCQRLIQAFQDDIQINIYPKLSKLILGYNQLGHQ